jgi:surfactin synthase thioesterase subunit
MRLFCLPHAGGTSRIFKPWLAFLGPDTELVALDLAGRGARPNEPGPKTFAAAADDLARIIADRAGGEDYALYGHSMGALLAYEVAHRLAERGSPGPVMLFAAACRPPGHRRPGPMLHTFPDEALLGVMAAVGGVPAEILRDRELVEFYAGLIRDDYRLYEEHAAVVEPRPLPCPIAVIAGSDDPIAPAAAAHGWTGATAETISVLVLDGTGHFFDDRIEQIVKHIESALARVGRPAGRPEAADLLGRLRLADVRLSVTGSGLSYDAPEGALDDALLSLMAEHKDDLTALVAAGGPVEASGPVSWGQRRSIDKLETTSEPAGFNIAMRLSVAGALDVPALERALTLLVARHGGLRTRLVRYGEHLVQERLPPARVPLAVVDFGELPAPERGAAVDTWLRAGARVPFPLGEGPLFRASLAGVGPDAWELLMVVQHTVSDAWSNATMLRDLTELYRPGGHLPPVAADPLEFARWEQDHYQGPVLSELNRWWTDLLADASLTYRLPADRPRPPVLSGRGGLHEFTIPAPLADSVRRYADRLGATEFAVLFATFLQWLSGLTGQSDLTVPVNYANRPRREYEDLVGFFVDNVAVRIVLDDTEPFDGLVRRAGAALFESMDRFLSFGLLIELLQAAGKDGVGVFPQVPFVVLNTPPMRAALADLDVSLTLVPTGGAKAEFSFILEPEDGGWHGFVPFQADMFDDETMAAWCAGYVGLLERRIAGGTV